MGRKAVGLKKNGPPAEYVLVKSISAANSGKQISMYPIFLRREILPHLEGSENAKWWV